MENYIVSSKFHLVGQEGDQNLIFLLDPFIIINIFNEFTTFDFNNNSTNKNVVGNMTFSIDQMKQFCELPCMSLFTFHTFSSALYHLILHSH